MREIMGYPVDVVPDERTGGCAALSEVRQGRRRILVSERLSAPERDAAALRAAASFAAPGNDIAPQSQFRLTLP